MEMKPKTNGGVPVCSRTSCDMFHSSVESGWGVATRCFAWREKDCGKPPHYFDDMTMCRPYLNSVGFK